MRQQTHDPVRVTVHTTDCGAGFGDGVREIRTARTSAAVSTQGTRTGERKLCMLLFIQITALF